MDPINDTLSILFYRTSVRTYQDKSISSLHRDLIFHAAFRAPTAGNLMMYSIIEVLDPQKKATLAETCDHQPFIATAPMVLLFLADMQRLYDYYEISKVPMFCSEKKRIYSTPRESDLLLACCDALIAAQNAVIAAESLGIGSCYIGDIMEQFEIHQKIFNLPRWTFPIALVCFGYPKSTLAPDQRQLSSRFDQKKVIFPNQYRRLELEELESLFQARLDFRNFKPDKNTYQAENFGQALYSFKTGATFSEEMARSVKKALQTWLLA